MTNDESAESLGKQYDSACQLLGSDNWGHVKMALGLLASIDCAELLDRLAQGITCKLGRVVFAKNTEIARVMGPSVVRGPCKREGRNAEATRHSHIVVAIHALFHGHTEKAKCIKCRIGDDVSPIAALPHLASLEFEGDWGADGSPLAILT